MTNKNLLVELFVEELPPKALKKLGDAFAGVLFEQLKAQGLTATESAVTPFASPRRLAAHVTAVAARAADKAVSQKLMPVSVGLDATGAPTPARPDGATGRGRSEADGPLAQVAGDLAAGIAGCSAGAHGESGADEHDLLDELAERQGSVRPRGVLAPQRTSNGSEVAAGAVAFPARRRRGTAQKGGLRI